MTNDFRTADDIERDIEEERMQLRTSVSDLQKKFSPEAIVRDVGTMLRDQTGDLQRGIRQVVGRSPVAVMMIGAGLAWLMISTGRSDAEARSTKRPARPLPLGGSGPAIASHNETANWWAEATSAAANTGDRAMTEIQSRAEAVVDATTSTASVLGDKATDVVQRLMRGTDGLSAEGKARVLAARQAAQAARASASAVLHQGTEAAAGIFAEQPLVIGALAVAVGAAIGGALPRTRMEDQNFGATSDQLFAEAQAIYKEERAKAMVVLKSAKQQITDTIKDTVEDTKSEVAALFPEGKTAADMVVDRVADAASRVVEGVKTEAQRQGLGKPEV